MHSRFADRLLALLLPVFIAVGCTAQPPTPTPTSTPGSSAPASPALPTATTAGTGTASPSSAAPSTAPPPTATPTASPTETATPTLTPVPSIDTAALAANLEQVLERQRARYRIPGVGAAVIMPNGWSWSSGAGFASLEQERPADGDTPFVVGSITKTFVTALIMQLADEGRLSLDDRLSEWLPRYGRHNGATLRQLLAHTSGIFNYFEHPEYNRRVFGEPGKEWKPNEILNEFAAPPYFAAGTGYHYSNTGFVLLGLVIEAATGNSLADEMARRFFDGLALVNTFFQDEQPPPPRSAQAYLVGNNGTRLINDGTDYRPTTSAATVAWAAGAVVASAEDLARWARTLYGGDLLAEEYLAEMTDFMANPYAGHAYGLGTRTRLIEGRQVIGHTGSLRGYAAAMWYFPAQDITIVVLSNRGRVDVNPIADEIGAVALEAAGYPTLP